MKYIYVLLILLFVGCATEAKRKTPEQLFTPDRFKLQFNLNVDEKDDYEGHSTLDQIRFGFDWNL